MSEAIGKSPSVFSNYAYRNSLPSMSILTELQKHGLDLFWLFTGDTYTGQPKPEGLDIESERAYILQERFIRSQQAGSYEQDRQRSTTGDTMDALSIAELWDRLSNEFPGTPLWEQLTETVKRDFLFDFAQHMLTKQHQAGRTESTEE